MKNCIYRIAGGALFLLAFSTCNLFEFDDYLNDPVAVSPENSEVSLVMNSAQLEFVNMVDEVSDETSPYVRLVAMQGGTRYQNEDTPSSFDGLYTIVYANLLPDLNLVIEQSDEGGFTLIAGAARVLKAYALYTMVDLFGDIPYTETGFGIENPSPVADDDAAVYAQADQILELAISNLSDPVGSFSSDLYYGGSSESWLALANTLKLRRAVQTKLVNSDAAATINAVLAGESLIDMISEDFQWQYGTNDAAPDARHPQYSDDYMTAPGGYMSNYYMWLFFNDKTVVDPRLRYYFYRQDCDETNEDAFTLDCATAPYPAHWPNGYPFCTASGDQGDPSGFYSGYWGRDHGNADGIPPDGPKRTVWGVYPVGGKFDADDCTSVQNNGADGGRGAGIQPIFLSSFTHFLLAEAALTIDGVEGDPLEYLLTGVEQSIEKVMGFSSVAPVDPDFAPTEANVTAYLTAVRNLYNAAGSDEERLNVIIKEFFLALHGQGLDAFNAYRRTGKPVGLQPTEEPSPGVFPRSFWYPSNYVNRNENVTQKTDLSGQVFWDTNPAGFIN